MVTSSLSERRASLEGGPIAYAARLARDEQDVSAAQTLRYEVFNLELGAGLQRSYGSGQDQDEFDPVCDHLIVEHLLSQQVVGTYRLQPGSHARLNRGFYSANEFELTVLEGISNEVVELGRACIHRDHRHLKVLGLLWRGICSYAQSHQARYLFGSSSLNSRIPAVGASVYADLCRAHLAPPCFRTKPKPGFECPLDQLCEEPQSVPKLLRAYLGMGAKICGPPAVDHSFGTIDFLTLMDLESISPPARDRFILSATTTARNGT